MVFDGLLFGEKIKIDKKIADTTFKDFHIYKFHRRNPRQIGFYNVH